VISDVIQHGESEIETVGLTSEVVETDSIVNEDLGFPEEEKIDIQQQLKSTESEDLVIQTDTDDIALTEFEEIATEVDGSVKKGVESLEEVEEECSNEGIANPNLVTPSHQEEYSSFAGSTTNQDEYSSFAGSSKLTSPQDERNTGLHTRSSPKMKTLKSISSGEESESISIETIVQSDEFTEKHRFDDVRHSRKVSLYTESDEFFSQSEIGDFSSPQVIEKSSKTYDDLREKNVEENTKVKESVFDARDEGPSTEVSFVEESFSDEVQIDSESNLPDRTMEQIEEVVQATWNDIWSELLIDVVSIKNSKNLKIWTENALILNSSKELSQRWSDTNDENVCGVADRLLDELIQEIVGDLRTT